MGYSRLIIAETAPSRSRFRSSFSQDILPDIEDRIGHEPRTNLYSFVPVFTTLVTVLQVFLFVSLNEYQIDNLCYDFNRKGQIWRFLTYGFLHVNVAHLLSNVAVQFLLGLALEWHQGWWRTLIIVFSGDITGAIGIHLLNGNNNLKVVGSSAISYALFTSHIINIITNFRDLKYKKYIAVAVASVSIGDIMAYGIIKLYDSGHSIVWSAHVFGCLDGLLFGIILLTQTCSARWVIAARYISVILLTIFFTVFMIPYVKWLNEITCDCGS